MLQHITICILDDNQERCLREEKNLDQAIEDKNLDVYGISNFGPCFLARTGLDGKYPVIDVNGQYFMPPNVGEELTYDKICNFLDMLVRKNIIKVK